MSWLRLFLILCPTLVTAGLLGAWATQGFDRFGLTTEGLIALIVGSVLASALAIGLMALVFFSSRGGHDAHVGRPDPPPDHGDD